MPAVDVRRAFIALPLPASLRQQLGAAALELDEGMPRGTVRWVRPENMHLTLRFLGDSRPEQLASLEGRLDQLARRHAPFALHLDNLGCFPNLRQPRVIWVGLTGFLERLTALQADVEAAAELLGWPAEGRAFQPHLTLGRVNRSASLPGVLLPIGRPLVEASFSAAEIQFIESQLRPGGPAHRLRHTSRLAGIVV
ncbi:MAG: RNA 2',3'-cyclic phosphodiesterase [Candidatus Promineifilaceae bacterium]